MAEELENGAFRQDGAAREGGMPPAREAYHAALRTERVTPTREGYGGASGESASGRTGFGGSRDGGLASGLAPGRDGGRDAGSAITSGEASGAHAEQADGEGYRLTAPEGYPISEEELSDFNRHCLDVGMTREQAERSLEMLHSRFQMAQEQFAAQRQDWIAEIRADREFGGGRLKASLADAKRALAAFDADGSVRVMLDETGYGDNPAVIRLFARIGRAFGEDRMITGRGGREGRPLEERLYPDM